MEDLDQEPIDMQQFKPAVKNDVNDLAGLMQKMQITVVGRETGKDSDYAESESEESND